MKSKYEAYPFLSEEALMCDYEVMTDRYASGVGELYALVSPEDKDMIKFICEIVYHANPCVRNENTITDKDIEQLREYMDSYNMYVPKYFVLPLDENLVAGRCQVLRAEAKQVVRLLYKIVREEKRDVNQNVFDVFHLVSQIMFGMAMKYAVKVEQFHSRTYK